MYDEIHGAFREVQRTYDLILGTKLNYDNVVSYPFGEAVMASIRESSKDADKAYEGVIVGLDQENNEH